jgi:hypothetical protein
VLKGQPDYHSSEIAAEVARRGPGGRAKGLLSQGIYSRRELNNSSILNQTRVTGSPLEKYFTTNKKELLTLSQGNGEEEIADDDDDDEWNQSSQSQVHVTVIRGN